MHILLLISAAVSVVFSALYWCWYECAASKLKAPTRGFPMTEGEVNDRYSVFITAVVIATLLVLLSWWCDNVDQRAWVLSLQVLFGGCFTWCVVFDRK